MEERDAFPEPSGVDVLEDSTGAEVEAVGEALADPAGSRALLRGSHFWDARNGVVFTAAMALHERGVAPDFVNVLEVLEREGLITLHSEGSPHKFG